MTDQVLLVTGGASGIGQATAVLAASRGARVAIVDLEVDRAKATANDCRRAGGQGAMWIEADVSNESSISDAWEACQAELGVPDALFACAGVEINEPLESLPLETWTRALDVNLTGVFLTIKQATSVLLAHGRPGSIVACSSPAAFLGFAGGDNAAYAASKGGLSAFMRSVAVDVASRGIRVNAVVPGATRTRLLTVGTANHPARSMTEIDAAAKAQIPIGRLAEPQEIAAAVCWLLSDEASYVTGSHLYVDGGLTARSSNDF